MSTNLAIFPQVTPVEACQLGEALMSYVMTIATPKVARTAQSFNLVLFQAFILGSKIKQLEKFQALCETVHEIQEEDREAVVDLIWLAAKVRHANWLTQEAALAVGARDEAENLDEMYRDRLGKSTATVKQWVAKIWRM